jgi:hypothetical protein
MLGGCAQDDLTGRWSLRVAGSERVVGRLLIHHTPTGSANMSDRIRMEAELRGQRLRMEGAYWHGGTFAVVGRGCRAETGVCADSVKYLLGARTEGGQGIDDRFDAELVVLPDTAWRSDNPIFPFLESTPEATYRARRD